MSALPQQGGIITSATRHNVIDIASELLESMTLSQIPVLQILDVVEATSRVLAGFSLLYADPGHLYISERIQP